MFHLEILSAEKKAIAVGKIIEAVMSSLIARLVSELPEENSKKLLELMEAEDKEGLNAFLNTNVGNMSVLVQYELDTLLKASEDIQSEV